LTYIALHAFVGTISLARGNALVDVDLDTLVEDRGLNPRMLANTTTIIIETL
jgi:hypothetical protein